MPACCDVLSSFTCETPTLSFSVTTGIPRRLTSASYPDWKCDTAYSMIDAAFHVRCTWSQIVETTNQADTRRHRIMLQQPSQFNLLPIDKTYVVEYVEEWKTLSSCRFSA
uniref:Uncharacterized protein n=1 Tax=Pectinophora gossypiella TaxID=13191 RepID=A0A1E1WNY0_PECGO